MKKYQLWLERKSYSQHLFNLMKIRYSTAKNEQVQKVHKKHTSNDNVCTLFSRYKEIEQFHQSTDNLNDLNYAITYKQLRNRKIRLMKTFQIMNENMSIARRLKETKSAIHSITEKSNNNSQIFKRKVDEKRLKITNQYLRNQKFNQFKKVCELKPHPKLHKYYFRLQIVNYTKLLRSNNEFSQIWCQISTQKGYSRSEPVHVQNLYNKKFVFPLESPLSKQIGLKILMSKGLVNDIISQFIIVVPNFKQQSQSWFKSKDNRFEIELKLKYDRIAKIKPNLSIK